MTDTCVIKWYTDRELPISLHEQIKGQIASSIANGELAPGAPMPSVRKMASMLKVSMITVSIVYRELIHEGLLISQPRVGYFVAPSSSIHTSSYKRKAQKNLQQLLNNSIRQAMLLGYSIEEVQEVFRVISNQYAQKQ